MSRPLRTAAAFVLALAAASSASPASAQRGAYRRVIRQAVAEFETENWAEARALFEEAHAIDPNARTLRGIGMCAFELRQYDDAIRILRESISSERRPLTRGLRTGAEDLIARAEHFIGRYRVAVDPPEAELRVDDAMAEPNLDGEIVLNLGAHVFVASLDGHETSRRRVETRGGESEDISLVLRPESETRVVVVAQASEVPNEAVGLLLGAGGSLLVEAYAIGWIVERQAERDVCANPPPGFRCDNAGSIGEQLDAALVTAVIFGVATLGLAAAGALWWFFAVNGDTAGTPEDDAQAVRGQCGVTGLGLACAGRF